MIPSLPALLRFGLPAYILVALLSRAAQGTVGVVDIQDLLDPDLQKPLASPDKPRSSSKPASKHAPWTHAPECTHSTSFKNLGSKYCLYTNKNAFINGISILTTPKTAEEAAQHLNEEPLSYFLSVDEVNEWFDQESRPWKIVDVPGKDLGVVATRKIKRYETFMVDQANVVMDLEMEKHVSKKDNLRLLKKAVDRLNNPGWVRQLSKKHDGHAEDADEVEEEGAMEEHIMMTNAFGTQLGDVNFRGLFPLVSRINHACDPNAFVMFSNSGFSLGIKAYSDIEPGEEITISYLLLGKTYKARQEGLKRWGFNCTCSLCSQPAEQRAESDARRERIEALEPQLLSLYKEGRHNAAIYAGEETVDLMREEGLISLLPDVYVMLTRLYLLIEDREKAKEVSDLALEILEDLGFLGADGREGWSMERLLSVFSDRGVY